jgi:exodeoxyribonuclease VII small subunit
MSKPTESPKEELSYETAFARLEILLAELEAGELPLEEALDRYEEGVKLAALCERLLEEAELRVRRWQPDDEPVDFDDWEDV